MSVENRINDLRKYMNENNIDVNIIMNPDNQYYISGFKAIIYSRPIVLVVDKEKTALIVPGLEEAHARHEANVDELHVYYEHPQESHKGTTHTEHLKNILSTNTTYKTIGVEYGHMNISLANTLKDIGFEVVDIGTKITQMKFIKDEEEIEVIKHAGRLVSLALKTSLENAKAGISEIELDQFGNEIIFDTVAKEFPNAVLDFFVMSPSGIERSIMPHVFSNTRKLEEEEIIIHSRQISLNGYRAECERTFFIGEPTEEQRRIFNIAKEAQEAILKNIKPGLKACEVDKIGRDIIEKAGLSQYAIHRVGHGIGLGLHEEPYLRFDSEVVLEENMVFSVEPGIYVPGVGGFRHSDTVIITKDGCELVTDYYRELEDLIINKTECAIG